MKRVLAVAAMGAVVTAATMRDTSPVQEPFFQAARVVAARDSFDLLVNGQVRGSFITEVARQNNSFRMNSQFAIAAAQEDHIVTFDAQLVPVSHTARQRANNTQFVTEIQVSAGRAKGPSQRPRQGAAGVVDTVSVDVAIPERTIDDEAVPVLIPTLELADGFAMSFNTLDIPRGVIITNQLKVVGRETVTVPAGTFEVWNITIQYSTSPAPVTMMVTTTSPRQLVLVRQGPLELKLVKRSTL